MLGPLEDIIQFASEQIGSIQCKIGGFIYCMGFQATLHSIHNLFLPLQGMQVGMAWSQLTLYSNSWCGESWSKEIHAAFNPNVLLGQRIHLPIRLIIYTYLLRQNMTSLVQD